ncbi:MAG: ammonium transporter [Verrucomicrobiota bacterium]
MKSTLSRNLSLFLCAFAGISLFAGAITSANAQEGEPTPGPVAEIAEADSEFARESGDAYAIFVVDNLWILIAAFLVFTMHLGFSTLESGLTRQKNTVNILFKNVFIICAGILTYAIIGFNLMYPGFGDGEGFLKFAGFGIPGMGSLEDASLTTPMGYELDMTTWADFLFQAMFAATGATIVSGAVAERIKLSSFMIFATLLVAIAYPISGSWKWGAGWLDQKGFYDFAGSSVVHAFGGFAALACVILLGARKGKYGSDGSIKPILGHSMPLATMGVFLLWLGWFGFNGGSVLNADPILVSYVCVTTAIAAAAGGVAAMLISWIFLKKPDLSMALNGILAGLVGITAGADSVGVLAAAIIGLVAGCIVVFAIIGFDKIKIDDPVGAISVHGVCGIWGTLAVGIGFFNGGNADLSFGTQLLGTLAISIWAFAFAFIVFGALKLIMGVRVSEEEEVEGLDMGEHGVPAYADFASR